jgi:hypothetical protein
VMLSGRYFKPPAYCSYFSMTQSLPLLIPGIGTRIHGQVQCPRKAFIEGEVHTVGKDVRRHHRPPSLNSIPHLQGHANVICHSWATFDRFEEEFQRL